MPPSGFGPHNTPGIKDFLRSLTDDLYREITRKKVTPRQGLIEEIVNIDNDLRDIKRSPAATAILQLVRAYYSNMAESMPKTADETVFFSAAAKHRVAIANEILEIEVLESTSA